MTSSTLHPGVFLQPEGPQRPNSPRTALLVGCDTLGAAIGSEWTTLSTALLWAGGRQIVTTLWPMLDIPEARLIEDQLVGAAFANDDLADTLRSIQLDGLRRWRNDLDPTLARAPYVWAGYTIICGPRP
jgi:CHAT domain-containing protein